uniref:MICAL-like 1 n=1 Tax=Nothobranchius rachovii TaxID=451742 RepID=A0A1A8Q4D5_9TELE
MSSEGDQRQAPSINQTSSGITSSDSDSTTNRDLRDEAKEMNGSKETEDNSPPPNPFDESEGEDDDEEETPTKPMSSEGPPPSDGVVKEAPRPVPAPRRVSDHSPLPRPVPRVRLSRTTVSERQKPPTPPKPQERSSTPPQPSNPFDDEDDEDDEENDEEGGEAGAVPPSVAATHPWYNITRAADSAAAETPPSRSASPASAKSKKRLAPRAPQPPATNQAPSQPSSCNPSPALSVESLSSASDHSSAHLPLCAGAGSDQERGFTKSVSEPSICSPGGDNPPSPSSSTADPMPHTSSSPSPFPLASTSSAPATPQSSRSSGSAPPRPTTTPSPLATPSNRKVIKSPLKKAPPSAAKPETRPPRGPRPARPPAPGHGFPLIKRKVQSDQYIPVEDIQGEMVQLEKQLDELEQRGVELEKKLRDSPNDEDEERLLVDWFTLIHDKHLLVRREAELVYTAKQQNLEERQADVEYELRCLLNKPGV